MSFDSLFSANDNNRQELSQPLLTQMQNLHDQADALSVMQDDLRGAAPVLVQHVDAVANAFRNFALLVADARAMVGAR